MKARLEEVLGIVVERSWHSGDGRGIETIMHEKFNQLYYKSQSLNKNDLKK